jgi:hypothetical protein
MSYFINPIEDERCVCLSCEGEIPPQELAGISYEVRGLLDTRHWRRIMVDITQLQSDLTRPQLLDFAEVLAGRMPGNARVALVVRPDQDRQVKRLKKVSRKCRVFLASFDDPDLAELWVNQPQVPDKHAPK